MVLPGWLTSVPVFITGNLNAPRIEVGRCAGNSYMTKIVRLSRPVYPRWRGELAASSTGDWSNHGLSPLTRGTHSTPEYRGMSLRFIPAGAGNSGTATITRAVHAVYPRWRGELLIDVYRTTHGRGLSPLARGTRLLQYSSRHSSRFIPAGAGNSRDPAKARAIAPVYPRWRGELIGAIEGLTD